MNTKTPEKIILWACIEDYVPLWQLMWELNSAYPSSTLKQRTALLFKVISYLLENSFLNAFSFRDGIRTNMSIDKIQLANIFKDKKNLEPSSLEKGDIQFGTTDKGEDYHRTL